MFDACCVQCENILLLVFTGYKLSTMLLHQFAGLGAPERGLLVSQGGVYRVVCSVLSANPAANRIPDSHMRHSIGV